MRNSGDSVIGALGEWRRRSGQEAVGVVEREVVESSGR